MGVRGMGGVMWVSEGMGGWGDKYSIIFCLHVSRDLSFVNHIVNITQRCSYIWWYVDVVVHKDLL